MIIKLSSSKSSNSDIILSKSNKHPINKTNILLWLDKCDKSVKSNS
jgi:hypothetical protein